MFYNSMGQLEDLKIYHQNSLLYLLPWRFARGKIEEEVHLPYWKRELQKLTFYVDKNHLHVKKPVIRKLKLNHFKDTLPCQRTKTDLWDEVRKKIVDISGRVFLLVVGSSDRVGEFSVMYYGVHAAIHGGGYPYKDLDKTMSDT